MQELQRQIHSKCELMGDERALEEERKREEEEERRMEEHRAKLKQQEERRRQIEKEEREARERKGAVLTKPLIYSICDCCQCMMV